CAGSIVWKISSGQKIPWSQTAAQILGTAAIPRIPRIHGARPWVASEFMPRCRRAIDSPCAGVRLLLHGACEPQVELRIGEVGLEPQRFLELCDRLFETTGTGEGDTQIVAHFRIVWLEFERAREMFDRFGVLAALGQCAAEIVESLYMSRLEPQRLPEVV